MSKIASIHGAIELTRDSATVFTGIGAFIPGETRTLGTRVGIGFGEVTAICKVTSAAPGIMAGTLTIEQSVDGVIYDQVDSFPMLGAGALVTVAIKIAGKYVRARFAVPVGEVYGIRFGSLLKPQTSP
jgi:hypothetical protein